MNIVLKILKNSKVDIKTPYIPTELIGDGDKINKLSLEDVNGEDKEIVDVDAVIVNYGFVSSLGPIKEWGLRNRKELDSWLTLKWKQIFLEFMLQVTFAHTKEKLN